MSNDTLSISFLNPEECSFSYNKNGFLVFSYNNEYKGRVKLIRSYPFSLKNEYICVTDLENEEYGIIKDLDELDNTSKEAAKEELKERYYCPTVTSVKSIKERMGHFYFDVIIDNKEKSFTVRDLTKNLRFTDEKTILIFDVDGNRYLIPDYEGIERKSKRILDPYIY
ncbi:MAG: DUF1854 domain-containing protein [Acutalibacteraceae bacterium]